MEQTYDTRVKLKQAAKELGVSVKTIYRRIESGRYSAIKDNGCWYLLRNKLEVYKRGE